MTAKQIKALRSIPVGETGNRLADAFQISGLPQMACVRRTRFTAQYVSDVKNGRFRDISVENAREFASFFGCQIEDLFPAREAVA
jgi:hypothetical protein